MRITCETKDTLSINQLTEFQGGLKERTADDLDKIQRSIEKYGFATPFFVWRNDGVNEVLDGHGRLTAVKRMQAGGEEIPPLPVVYVKCKDVAEAKNLLLRINSTYGKMTADTIAEFIGDLKIDVDDIKLPEGIIDLTSLEETKETKNDDEVPEVHEEEVHSKPGEIYELGNNRLICGDSTDPAVLAQLMGDSLADLIITDPPYNVAIIGGDHKVNAGKREAAGKKKIDNDKMDDGEFEQFLERAFTAMLEVSKAGGAYYVFHAFASAQQFETALKAVNAAPHSQLIWVKNRIVFGYQDYLWKHEPIFYGWKNGAGHKFYGLTNESTVFDQRKDPEKMSKAELVELVKKIEGDVPTTIIYEKRPGKNIEHPTMKPVNLLERLVNNSSKRDDIILDPFGGSGSTLIAAAKNGRRARLCELSPAYCDVIRRRWTKWAKDNGYTVGNGGLE